MIQCDKESRNLNKPIILIDCMNVGHIAFHAMGELDYHGRRTGAIFGFMRKVLELAKEFETSRFIFCWDSQRSVRRMLYPGYKKREKSGKKLSTGEIIDYEAMHDQMVDLRKGLLYQLGFNNSFMYAGLEADDVMALAICNSIIDPGWCPNGRPPRFVIASTDRDMYQCLALNVDIYNLRTKKLFTKTDFEAHYGIKVEQWVQAKALGGCDSDTVAGIPGIADPAKSDTSRALAYLKGTLGGAYKEAIESDKGKAIYERNLTLVTLPITYKVKPHIKADVLRKDTFIEVFDTLGFASFLKHEKFTEWEAYFELR